MAKKNAFLEALENTDFGKIDIKGIEVGADYSSITKQIPADSKTPQLQKTINPKTFEQKPEKRQGNSEKQYVPIDKPKQVRLKSKIVNQKPIIQAKTENSKLDISLSFLDGMTYEQKVEYLAINGWSLHLERYKGIHFEVAQKYIERRKFRIYLKELSVPPNYDDYSKTDILKVKNMISITDKKIYLFRRGWSVKVMVRGFQEYEYAVRYFNRKKKMIYLGVYSQNEVKIFPK